MEMETETEPETNLIALQDWLVRHPRAQSRPWIFHEIEELLHSVFRLRGFEYLPKDQELRTVISTPEFTRGLRVMRHSGNEMLEVLVFFEREIPGELLGAIHGLLSARNARYRYGKDVFDGRRGFFHQVCLFTEREKLDPGRFVTVVRNALRHSELLRRALNAVIEGGADPVEASGIGFAGSTRSLLAGMPGPDDSFRTPFSTQGRVLRFPS